MGIEIPDELQWVAKYILGAGDWPEGDETAMRRVADAWNAMAQTLDTVDDNAAVALNAALTALSEGETHTTIAAFRDKLLSGDEATLTAVRKWCEKQAELLDDGANDIEHTKLVIIGTMIVTAAELLAAGLTAWTGIGAVAGVAARVAAQVAVRVAIRQLIARMLTRGAAKAAARLALRGAAFEALEEGGTDLSARLIQVYNGDRALSKFGLTDLGLATFGGAVGGAVGGVLGGGTNVLADGLSSTAGKLAGKVVGGSVTELGADLSAQVAAAGVGAAFLGQEFNLDIGVDTFTSAGAGGIQSTLESSAHGGNATAPTVPELGTVAPGDTTPASTDAPSGDQPPTGTDNGTPDTPSGEPTTPASTGDPSSPTDDATSPQNTATADPATASPNDNGANGTPAPSDSAPAGPNSDTAPDAGNTSPTPNPDTDGSPATPDTGDATPSSPNGNPDTGDSTPSSPENSGPTQAPAPADTTSAGPTTPVTPSPVDAAPTNGTPPTGDTTPTIATPPTGDTTPTNVTPSTGDTTPPSNPTNGATPATPTPGDTTPNTPLNPPAQSPATDPDQANTPPAQQAPTSTTPNGVTQPESAPTTTPATPQTPPATPTPPVTTTPDTQPATSTPAATTPGISPTTTPSNPATTQSAPADTTRPTSPDTSTAAATTATPVSQTGTPTPATTPTTPPPTTPTSTPTPPITQGPTATSAPSSPRPTTLAPTSSTPASPQSTPPTPASQPNTPATTPNPPGTPTSTPTNQQDLGTNPTPPQSSNPTPPAAGPATTTPNSTTPQTTPAEQTTTPATTPTRATTPTPVPTPTTDQNPDPGHSPNARPLRDSLRNLPSQDGRTTTVDTNRTPSQTRPPAYRIRRFHIGGQWVSVATIRAYIPNAHLMTPAELHQEIEYAQAAIDATFNHNQELPGGDRLLVDVEFTTNPNAADLRLNTQQHRFDLANDLREHMGLPPGKPDQPLSEDDLRAISNDIARANTPARFTNPSDSRVMAPHRLEPVEQARFQHDVEDQLRNGNSFVVGADPRTHPYGQSINDGGPTVPGRSNNCLDCSLSALSSFYGVPQVSAPRWRDALPDGSRDNQSGEVGGPARAAAWLGETPQHFAGLPINTQFQALHDHVAALGPGSSALVINTWQVHVNGVPQFNPDGSPEIDGAHATVIVYPPGASGPVWWDPQSGHTSDAPPTHMVAESCAMHFYSVDANGGINNGGASSHTGTGPTSAGQGLRSESEIPDDRDQTRLGGTGNPDGGRTVPGDGSRPGELRPEQTHRSDHSAPELASATDRGGIRPGDRDRGPGTGIPGVATTAPHSPAEGLRGRSDSALPGHSDPAGPAGRPGDHPAGHDQQGNPVLPAERRTTVGRDSMGGNAQPDNRIMADRGSNRAVADHSTSTSAPSTTARVAAQPDETPSTTTTPTQAAAPQPVPTTGLPNTPGATPHSPDNSATPPPPASGAPTPQQIQNANRSRIARDNLRTRMPDGGVQPVTEPSGRRRFTWGRYTTALGAPVSVMRIGIHLTGAANLDPAAVAALLQRAQFAADLHFNGGFQLANGDWMMVDLVPVTNPADADMHMQVDSSGLPGTTHPNVDLSALTAQIRDQLGMDPNSDHVSPADLQQLSAAIDRATFTPPPPPWLSNPAPGTTEPELSRHTGPASLPNPRHGDGHAVPDNGRQLLPPPRPDFRAPESNPPPRHTIPTSTPTRQTPGPVDSTTPHSAPQTPHDPHSWGAPNPNHPSRTGGRRPLWRRILGLPPREPVANTPAPPPTPSTPPPPTTHHAAEFRPPIAPPAAQQVDDEFGACAYRSGPPFQTQSMSHQYDGEHIPGNQVWVTPPSHVAYLDENGRRALRLEVRNGLLYTANGELFDTSAGQTVWSGGGQAIFVMDQHGNLYASLEHSAGRFHHSSFLAGAPVAAAGELVVSRGVVQLLTDSSGHYRPERGHTLQAVEHLRRLGIPLSAAQVEFEAPR